MARIFISYRRDDSGYVAALLNEKLQERFGLDSVFFDVDHIPIGVDFRERINTAVSACDVLVVIGDRWLEARDEQGTRRLENPDDYVRLEIEAAFKRDIPVVPVLVDKSMMPAAGSLPAPLQSLSHRNAAEIRAGRDFRLHLERLVEALAELAPPARTPTKQARPRKTRRPAPQPEPPREPRAGVGKGSSPPATLEQVRAALGRVKNKQLFVGNKIPADKAERAVAAYAPRVKIERILLLYDNTLFGGAKNGLLMTDASVYWRNSWLSAGSKRYQDIHNVDVEAAKVAGMNIVVDGEKINIVSGDGDDVKLAFAIADVLRALSKAARHAIRRRAPSGESTV